MERDSQQDVGMAALETNLNRIRTKGPTLASLNKASNEKVLSGNPPKPLFTLRRVCSSLKIWMTQQQPESRNSIMENTIAVGVQA